jgi:hypothetical protein
MCYTEPEPDLSLLLTKLKLDLPAQPRPKITAGPVPPIPLQCRPLGIGLSNLNHLGVLTKVLESAKLGELRREPRRPSLCSPVAEFRDDDDAGANLCLAYLANAPGYPALRVAHEVGDDVGVEQVIYKASKLDGVSRQVGDRRKILAERG